ncbi:MAG: elongation factor G [Deltaproteobacteria bacterium]|nr:MAG: elongation factor G [Deltaproteobacteria bacterium]
MPSSPLARIRNFGIISHIDAGKTTVSERILYYSGEIHKLGEVHDGEATMDWMDQEQERGITITATATTCHWRDCTLNLIDTPGHIDFTIEVERSLRALDGALTIFSAVEGVQPQSESVWRQADRYRVPRICLVNKMDRVGADHLAVLGQMERRLGARPVLMQLPCGVEGDFAGVVDLLEERLLTFVENDRGTTVLAAPVPAELQPAAADARERLLEAAADWDDELLADLLDGRPPDAGRVRAALRRGVLACAIFPVFLGAALRNRGIQPVLDAVVDLLPSPLELPPVRAHRADGGDDELLPCDPRGPLCALAFKVQADEGRKLTYLRLYSGQVRAGDPVWNATRGCSERVARLFRMHAHKRERIEAAAAGEIVAAAGLRDVLTGDTLSPPGRPLRLAGLTVPEPVVSLAVEPRRVADRERLPAALEKLLWEDPTVRLKEDAETGQTVLTGMGELHLEVLLTRLEREFGVEVNAGQPQVVLRETITRETCHRELFERELDGRVQRGDVNLCLAPLPRGSGVRVQADKVAAGLPPEVLAALQETLEQGARVGPLAGYPLVDVAVEVVDVPFLPGATTLLGVRAAAQRGLVMAVRAAGATLLEPVMALEVTTPGEFSGRVLGGLQQKRGRVEGLESREGYDIIRATVPLAAMFGYMTELRSATQGRGSFTMAFSHYDQAPPATLARFGLG